MAIKLLALSGIDGAGKSTQLNLIQEDFEKNGESVVYLWTRGGNTPGVNGLKALLRKLAGKNLPASGHSVRRDKMLGKGWVQRVWLILAIVDLFRIYSISIRWWLSRGKVVVCDRYLWDTLIDFKIMFPAVAVEGWLLWRLLVWFTPVPDEAVLLMIPLHLSEKRCLEKYEPFPDTTERRERRYGLYAAAADQKYWRVVDSTRAISAVFADIMGRR
jgi:dTMP kinase